MRKLIVLKSWIYLIRNLSLYAFNDCIKWWMWMRMLTFDFLILVKFLVFSWLLKSEWKDSFWIFENNICVFFGEDNGFNLIFFGEKISFDEWLQVRKVFLSWKRGNELSERLLAEGEEGGRRVIKISKGGKRVNLKNLGYFCCFLQRKIKSLGFFWT